MKSTSFRMPRNRIKKLPKWAQELIKTLENRIEESFHAGTRFDPLSCILGDTENEPES